MIVKTIHDIQTKTKLEVGLNADEKVFLHLERLDDHFDMNVITLDDEDVCFLIDELKKLI